MESVLSQELVELLKKEHITIIKEEEAIIKLSINMKVSFVEKIETIIEILVNQGTENRMVIKSDIGITILSVKQLILIQRVEKEFQQKMIELKTLTPAMEIIMKRMTDQKEKLKDYQIICPKCNSGHDIVLSKGIRDFGETQATFECPNCNYEMDIEYDKEKDTVTVTSKIKEIRA